MSIPDITLLFQDLLSPPTTLLASTTPALITYHLSTAPTPLVTTLIRYLSSSPSLWKGQASYDASSDASSWAALNWQRSREIYDALRNGILYRVGEITKEVGTGWRARRRLGTFLDALFAGIQDQGEDGPASFAIHPAVRLLVASAGLKGMQLVKLRKDKLYVGGAAHLGRGEQEVLKAWEGYSAASNRPGSSNLHLRDDDMLPTWLASETLPLFSIDSLQAGPIKPLLDLLMQSFHRIFSSGNLFASLSSDLASTPNGTHWIHPSPSHVELSSIAESPLFVALGPLSRAIGRCVEAAGRNKGEDAVTAIQSCADSCERLSKRVQAGWSKSGWCDLEDDKLDEETRKMTIPWTILKSYLFSLTLIQSALLILLSPLPSTEPTPLQLQLAAQLLRILGLTYFITIKFGSEGFGAWRGVWSGLIEVIGQGKDPVAKLMIDLEPQQRILHETKVDRSIATFYLNVAEQLMPSIASPYVESSVLQVCHPYLINPKHRDTFESAHSVLLSIFASEKDCANDLSPWYTTLLLQAYPTLMTASQLRLAFTTMIRCVSNSDDSLAWYCLLQLIEAIKALPRSSTTASTSSPTTSSTTSSSSSSRDGDNSASAREFDEESSSTRLDEAVTLSPLESQALQLQRGHLLLTLIDQTTSVNLILLRSLLSQIWIFVKEEESGEETGKAALVKVVFNTLGEGLDATKRDEGVRWWLNRSEELA